MRYGRGAGCKAVIDEGTDFVMIKGACRKGWCIGRDTATAKTGLEIHTPKNVSFAIHKANEISYISHYSK
jgi:hypothetical protein